MSTPSSPRARSTAALVATVLAVTVGATALVVDRANDGGTDPIVTAASSDPIVAAPAPSYQLVPAGPALADTIAQRAASAQTLAPEVAPTPAPQPTESEEPPAPEPEPEPDHAHDPEPAVAPSPPHEHEPQPAPEPQPAGNGRAYAGEDGVGTYNGARYSWDDLAGCESSGNWQSTEGTYEGGLQFHPQTWDAYKDPGMPNAAYEASRVQQMRVAEYVLDDQTWDAWPACSSKLGYR